jgi:uncharacterized membrane protein YphA (DoxX/SURF4 family)
VSLLRQRWLHIVLGLVVGGVFVYACLEKIWNPTEFARIVYHYQLIGPNAFLPPLVPNLLAVVLPWVELFAGLTLITGLWRREGALIAALMLAVFIAAVASTLARGIDLTNCGCFTLTAEGRAAGMLLIWQDLGLLLAALILAFLPPRKL